MRAWIGIVAGLSIVSVPGVVQGQVAQPAPPADNAAKLDELFKDFNSSSSPGCAVAVYKDGGVVLSRSYGMADLEQHRAIDAGSVFHLASISKQFTALAINLLIQEGKLSLSDPVRKFIPELPASAAEITIDQLLHHTSGLRDEFELLWMAGWRDEGDVKKLPDVMDLVSRQRALNGRPGTAHLYVNTNYTLLAEIVHRVSGQSISDFARREIFEPLDMRHTRFVENSQDVIENRATPYESDQKGGFRIAQRRFDYAGPMGIYTTIEDLALWEKNLLHPRVGDAETIRRMLAPGRLADGAPVNYGMGFELSSYRGLPIIYHDGFDAGYAATFLRFPVQKMAFATLCNRRGANAPQLSRSVADIYLASLLGPKDAPAAAPAATPAALQHPESYTGVFLNEENGIIREVLLSEGKLLFSRGSGTKGIPLVPLGGDRFMRGDVVTSIPLDDKGRPKHLQLLFQDGADTYAYVGRQPFEPDGKYLKSLEGTYHSPELGVDWTARIDSGKLVLKVPRNGDIVLRPAQRDTFGSTAPLGFLIQFSRGKGGAPEGFHVSNPRVKNLLFERVRGSSGR